MKKTTTTLELSGNDPQSQDYKFYTLHSQPKGIQIEEKFMRKKSCYDIDFFTYVMKRSRFHCKCPIKNNKNSLLALIFKQIAPNLEESVCTP